MLMAKRERIINYPRHKLGKHFPDLPTGQKIVFQSLEPYFPTDTRFAEIRKTVVNDIFCSEPKDVLIQKEERVIRIPAGLIRQSDRMEHIDRKNFIDAVAYAFWETDKIFLGIPKESKEAVINHANATKKPTNAFEQFINQEITI